LGGLNDAVKAAAELATIEDYRLVEMPALLDPFEKLITDLMGESTQTLLQKELGTNYKYYNYVKGLAEIKGIQARLPFEIDIN
jgi:protease-4